MRPRARFAAAGATCFACLLMGPSAQAAETEPPPTLPPSGVAVTEARDRPRRPGGLTFEPYVVRTFDGQEHRAELGRLWVSESRDRDTTHLMRLAFVRLKSRAARAGSPIVFLAGGPGVPGSALARVPVYYRLFDRLRELGDVILLDQRGTGLSEPELSCPASVEPAENLFVSERQASEALLPLIRSCAEHWRSRGVVLEAFQTKESADDIEEIRRAIGADRVRLLGMSYGSELALAVIRRHGPRVERAVLAGVRGPDQAIKLPGTLDLQLQRVAAMVARDSLYAPRIPDLDALVRALLKALERKEIWLSAKTRGDATRRMRIGPAGLQAVLQGDLTDGRAIAAVPAMLETMKRGDLRLFLGRLGRLYQSLASGTSVMSIAANCASGGSEERRARARREAAASPFGNIRNLYLAPEFCEAVGRPDLGDEYRSRIHSPVPTFFLSGSMDATTPPFEAEEVAWGFPNGVHLIVENAFHEMLPAADVQEAVVRFFRGEDVRGARLIAPPPRFLGPEEALRKLEEETRSRP